MKTIYTRESIPLDVGCSIFLVGPTPRSTATPSWRPKALQLLESMKFNGYVFVPERRNSDKLVLDEGDGEKVWLEQVEWEHAALTATKLIAAWVPRSDEMPAYTTNVEFGRYVTSGKLRYGCPEDAPRTRYLDWMYHKETGLMPHRSLEGLLSHAVRDCQ